MSIVKIIVIAILSFLLSFILPWYGFAIIAFIVGFFLAKYEGNSFFAGFIGVGLFWLLYIIFLDTKNGNQLSEEVAQIFSDSLDTEISGALLIASASILAGLIGGLAAWAGSLFAQTNNIGRQHSKFSRRTSNKRFKLNI